MGSLNPRTRRGEVKKVKQRHRGLPGDSSHTYVFVGMALGIKGVWNMLKVN